MTNRDFAFGFVLMLVLPLSIQTALAEDRLQPGLWRAQTTMGGQALSEPSDVCISEEGARTSNGTDDEVKQAIVDETLRNGCGASDIVIDGPRIAFTTLCQGIASLTDITYEGIHYAGTLTTQSPKGSMVLEVAGDHIGECPAS